MFPGSIINFLSNEDTPLLAAGFFIGSAQKAPPPHFLITLRSLKHPQGVSH
jgi:hypothetical protein